MKKTWFKSVFFFHSFCIVYNSIKYLFLLQKQEILDKNSNISFFFSFLVLYFFQVIMYLLINSIFIRKRFILSFSQRTTMSSIIIRIQSDLGFLRLTVNSNDTIQSLRSKISSTYKISYDDFLICTERHRMSIDHV